MSPLNADVTIRTAQAEDAADIQAIYAPFVQETSVSFETVPPSVETMAARISSNLARHGYFVAQSDAGILGFAYASPYRPRPAYDRTAEVSVYLAPQAQGRGLAQALYRALFAHLAARGFHTAVAIVTLPNPQSAQLHERCGFAHVGSLQDVGRKFGQWHGTAIYQRMIGQADLHSAVRRLEASDTAALAQVLRLIQTSFAYMTGRIDPPSSMHQLTVSALAQMAKTARCWLSEIRSRLALWPSLCRMRCIWAKLPLRAICVAAECCVHCWGGVRSWPAH